MVFIMPYTGKQFDEGFNILKKVIHDSLVYNKDDFVILVVGDRNTGKSHWMLNLYEHISWGGIDINMVAWDRAGFAKAMALNKSIVDVAERLKFIGYDEANVSGRASMSNWNRDLIDLLFSVRELNICYVWCNPNAEIIDKQIIKSKLIKGLVFLKDKTGGLRRYWYFDRQAIETLFYDYDLSLKTLNKMKKKLAWWRGWYKEYKGEIINHYNEGKKLRMDKKVDEFAEKYGESTDHMSKMQLGRIIKLKIAATTNYESELLKRGLLVEGEHFFYNPLGQRKYSMKAVDVFLALGKEKRERVTKTRFFKGHKNERKKKKEEDAKK